MKKQTKSKHLNQFNRDRIEALLSAGHNQSEIARILKVDKSTISREMKRKRKNGRYDAKTAQHKANVKRSNSKWEGMKIEKNIYLKKYIINGLKNKQSPDEISGRMKLEKQPFYASKDAIYKWLYSSHGQRYCRYLCSKRYRKKRQKKKTKREMIPNRMPLFMRPFCGVHAEGDLFVSSRKSGTTRSGALLVVPEAQYISGEMIENRKPKTMTKAVKKMSLRVKFDDLTLDNGIENKDHLSFGFCSYFADPYSPWQKPHVENNIGLLRKWFIPKKTNLCDVSNEDLQYYLHILNSKYRKSLGYRNAYEVALERGIIKSIPRVKIRRESCV